MKQVVMYGTGTMFCDLLNFFMTIFILACTNLSGSEILIWIWTEPDQQNVFIYIFDFVRTCLMLTSDMSTSRKAIRWVNIHKLNIY